MGEPVDGTRPLRSVKRSPALKRQRPAVKLSPQLERRRALRQEKRRELAIQIWRLVVMLLTGTVLGWSLLRFGWTLEGTDRILISGDVGIDPAAVAKVGGFQFPKPLLEINPQTLEARLLKDLPIQTAVVERRLFPARLELSLTARTPIARAVRRLGSNAEQGMIDAKANWIDLTAEIRQDKPETSILIDGWTTSRRSFIADLIEQRDAIGADLHTVLLKPEGQVVLKTRRLGEIQLGRDPSLLNQQIQAIAEMTQSMPEHLQQGSRGAIDLSNPERPEIVQPEQPSPAKKAAVPN